MSADALSTAQFGSAPTGNTPSASGVNPDAVASPSRTLGNAPQAPTSIPMPYSSSTNSGAKQTVAWQKPSGVSSLSAATTGTLLNPQAATQ